MLYLNIPEEKIMGATQTLIPKSVLFPALALFVMAPGLKADTPQFNAIGSVTLCGSGGAPVNVSSSGAPITFTAKVLPSTTVPPGDPAGWVSVSPGPFTTPATLSLGLKNLGPIAGTFTATIVLQATDSSGAADLTFPVTYTSGSTCGGGGGGGGGQNGTITPSLNPLNLSASPGYSALGTIDLSTTSAAAIGFSVSYLPQNSWLTVAPSGSGFAVSSGTKVTLTVIANAQNLSSSPPGGSITITPTSGMGLATIIPVYFTVGAGAGGTLTFSGVTTLTSNSGSEMRL